MEWSGKWLGFHPDVDREGYLWSRRRDCGWTRQWANFMTWLGPIIQQFFSEIKKKVRAIEEIKWSLRF